MLDYGEFVPEALIASSDSAYRQLGNKLELYEEEEKMYIDFKKGGLAYLDSYLYSKIQLATKVGVS